MYIVLSCYTYVSVVAEGFSILIVRVNMQIGISSNTKITFKLFPHKLKDPHHRSIWNSYTPLIHNMWSIKNNEDIHSLYKSHHYRVWFQVWTFLKKIVSEWLLFNAYSAVFQLYPGENKWIFNEMMMRSALY